MRVKNPPLLFFQPWGNWVGGSLASSPFVEMDEKIKENEIKSKKKVKMVFPG